MFKKIAIVGLFIVTASICLPNFVQAEVVGADSEIPELNPFCWKRKDCWVQRAAYLTGISTSNLTEADKAELNKGFVSNASVAPCVGGGDPSKGEDWGRCLPAGVAKTEIDFGGKSEFANVGVFILSMYKYLITVASIVSVIMIIVAGIQWITSGGNSESISSAKHRIGGAVIGLFIAYMSYFILNTINPNLVNFRLPQVWLVRPQELMPEYCSQIPNYEKLRFAYLFTADKESLPNPPSNQLKYLPLEQWESGHLNCGSVFLSEKGGSTRCLGDYCQNTPDNKSQICVRDNGASTFSCYEGDLTIHLSFTADITDSVKRAAENVPIVKLLTSKAMEDDWLYSGTVVRAVCKRNSDGALFLANGGEGVDWDKAKRIDTIKEKKKDNYYEYQEVYRGLTDPEEINNKFDCSGYTIFQRSISKPKPQIGVVVGYFIRYELVAKEAWVDDFNSAIKGAKIGAVAGWILPGFGTISGALIGGAVGWAVDLLDGPPKPNLNIGYEKGAAIFGVYADSKLRIEKPVWEELAAIKSLSSYIPIERLKQPGGLRLEVPISIRNLAVMMLYRGSVPKNESDVILPADSIKDPRHLENQDIEHGRNI